MYKLRSLARRSSLLGTSAALLLAVVAPGASVFADALNPLTNRSLTLSSSAPGWDFTDGSGNATYAPPNSGANGKKTGNTFQFKVSTNSTNTGENAKNTPIKAFTFQYCTSSAGDCYSPGNNGETGGTRNPDSVTNRTSDLNIEMGTAAEMGSATVATNINATTGNVTVAPNRDGSQGAYVVLTKSGSGSWTPVSGWLVKSENLESGSVTASKTGKKNYITLYNDSSTFKPAAGDGVKIIFFGTDNNYITNPGEGAFFVKINDYSGLTGTTANTSTIIDGGVTVANVMNQSIQITTKVLETMDFSVGTVDPNTLDSTNGTASTGTNQPSDLQKAMGVAPTTTANATKHTVCDRILRGIDAADVANQNVLLMGDTTAENSLSTAHTYSTHSYWRLSSNSSAGASVYYSGVTLSNTVGDQIDAIGKNPAAPAPGSKQFGLALTNGTLAANNPLANFTTNTNLSNVFPVNYANENTAGKLYENGADITTTGVHASVATDVNGNASWHTPRLFPLVPETPYDQGAGAVNSDYASVNTEFAFDTDSNKIPTLLATENNSVVDCVTGRMRYIANISATTPAGIYTTKINYIAAPQY